jgi:hypothetical protein
MQLKLGKGVRCKDGEAGDLVDLVVDPIGVRVTHLIVKPRTGFGQSRLVPIGLVDPSVAGDGLSVECTLAEVAALPGVSEFADIRMDEIPTDDPTWDRGVTDVSVLPYAADGPSGFGDVGVWYDRIPKGEVELRRASEVFTADHHRAGNVSGFVVDDADAHITEVTLGRGHLWWRREVRVPADAVAKFESDLITLDLSADGIDALSAHEKRGEAEDR